MRGGDGTITLLLSVDAIERLAAPAAAIADAGQWSDYVGVLGHESASIEEVKAYVDGLDADPDFVAGTATGSLAAVRQRFRTDRHVVVGGQEVHRDVASALGWEYLAVTEAAEAADWALSNGDER